jgi:hypothetical protein
VYFGGMLLPYRVKALWLEGAPVLHLTLRGARKVRADGWGSELSLLYYREALDYPFDPLEAPVFDSRHWHMNRFLMLVAYGSSILKMNAIHSASFFKPDGESTLPDRMLKCLETPYIFRIFEVERLK